MNRHQYRTLSFLLACLCSCSLFATHASFASEPSAKLLVKFASLTSARSFIASHPNEAEILSAKSHGVWVTAQSISLLELRKNSHVLKIQPDYPIHVIENESHLQFASSLLFNAETRALNFGGTPPSPVAPVAAKPKPEIPWWEERARGNDPEFSQQWGLTHIGVESAWGQALGDGVIVAVIDSGVDYTHEDLNASLWRNPGETGYDSRGYSRTSNQVDDDANGFVDDVIGWDFTANDGKPFDETATLEELNTTGGNAGHGTHCAGTIAAQTSNGIGVAGVAPHAQIMALRFMNQTGDGDTSAAVKAIHYAVKMGAKVLSNSWGTQGEDTSEPEANQALRDAINDARSAGVLFISAAGNGHKSVGYDNDTDPKPMYPATYAFDNIISVTAIDQQDQLASFANWGKKSVHVAAPGVAIFSTMVGDRYGAQIFTKTNGTSPTWNGTSMAAPFVAGAAALYWSKYPSATYDQVKRAIIDSARAVAGLKDKTVSGGVLDVARLVAPY